MHAERRTLEKLFSPHEIIDGGVKEICKHNEVAYRGEALASLVLCNHITTQAAQIRQHLP